VINGTKIWTSFAHLSDWMFILTRTDPEAPKHRGISFFMMDLKQPGVSMQPLVDASGEHVINQEFFENVRVPRRNLVGELNRGWYVGAALLDFERSGISWAARCRRRIHDLTRYAKETMRYGRRLIEDPIVRTKLAERAIEAETCRWIAYRVSSMQEQGLVPNMESSMAKMFGSELQQRVARTGTELLGLYGQVREGSQSASGASLAPLNGAMPLHYVNTIPDTIESGSSEIQRNVIATRGLGLPRI
jgi:alkylation response protein AidB-like acyl-CoA dehydrogenase